MFPKPRKAYRNRKYLEFVASKPCIYCLAQSGPPHHVRWASPCGGNQRPSDTCTIPICHDCHSAVHSMSGERFREITKRVGREQILLAMLDQADEWIGGGR